MSYGNVPRLIAPLVSFYQWLIYRWPAAALIWRYIGHRETKLPFRRIFATQELHDWIRKEYSHRSNGIFFEAGANDGLLFSNTAYLERYLGWTGILVEAVPHKFVECLGNREKSIVQHCALVGPDYRESSVEIKYCNLMSFTSAQTKIDEKRQIDQARHFMSRKERLLSGCVFRAPARTISDLLQEHEIQYIDLMIIDLEGGELNALRGINFDEVQIETLIIEANSLHEIDELLALHGYKRCAKLAALDYLYKRAKQIPVEFSCSNMVPECR